MQARHGTPGVLDARSDPGGYELHRICADLRVDALTKAAAEGSNRLEPGDLAPGQYADPLARAWPVHDKQAILVSAGYLYDSLPSLEPRRAARAEARLREEAALRGVLPEVEAIAKAAADRRRPAAPDADDYLYDGPEGRRLPVRSAAEAKAAAAWFERHADGLAYAARAGVARRLLAKAAALGAELAPGEADRLERAAGLGDAAAKAAAGLLRGRAALLGARPNAASRDAAERLRAKAAAVEADPARFRTPAARAELAEAVDALDRAFGVGPYRDGVPRPEEVLFPLTPSLLKRARAGLVDVGGAAYEAADLARLRRGEVRAALGDAAVEAARGPGLTLDYAKLAAAAGPDGARRLARLADARGIAPLDAPPPRDEATPAESDRLAALLG